MCSTACVCIGTLHAHYVSPEILPNQGSRILQHEEYVTFTMFQTIGRVIWGFLILQHNSGHENNEENRKTEEVSREINLT